MTYRFPYTRISNPYGGNLVKFRFHPLLRVGLLSNSILIKTEAYIDTGAQWCLFNNDFAKRLGIKNYQDTQDKVVLSGVGGKKPSNTAYFHKLNLVIFKDIKKDKLNNSWQIETLVGFLENPIGFSGILGVYGFLDHFSFKVHIPGGYFELEPIFET